MIVHSNRSQHIFDQTILRDIQEQDLHRTLRGVRARHMLRFLLNALQNCTITEPVRSIGVDSFFRYVNLGVIPTSVTGSFGCGGRLNVGAAQSLEEFSELRAMGGVYCSIEKATALCEYNTSGLPVVRASCYCLSSQTPLRLLVLDEILERLEQKIKLPGNQSLTAAVFAAPTEAAWGYIKYPLVSQVIGHWLRFESNLEAQGIIWQSTRRPQGQNAFLFLENGQQADEQLSAVLLP